MKSTFGFAAVILLAGCTASPKKVQREVPPGAQVTFVRGDVRVGTYVSVPDGFSTNSFWIEGPDGLILIDTQFLLSAANEAVDWAEDATGKKVVLAIVLHPNPDKFNGVGELKKRGIKVVTSDQVLAHIPEVHKDRHHWFYDRYKPDYPNEVSLPETFGKTTTEILAGGTSVKLHVLGAGASSAHVVAEFDKHIFTGDLVANLGHAWLELGLLDDWIERIQELKKLKSDFVHPGRGPSGGYEVLERFESYLKRVKKYVLAAKPRKKISEEEKEKVLSGIQSKLESDYPGYSNPYFVEIGLPAVYDRYAK
jgi:glyoxylase-like metal-dependent hydrolase (beta-lactamase superfamily II)